jgi:septal ring factor EnvC (AmiA/AmiB activator)
MSQTAPYHDELQATLERLANATANHARLRDDLRLSQGALADAQDQIARMAVSLSKERDHAKGLQEENAALARVLTGLNTRARAFIRGMVDVKALEVHKAFYAEDFIALVDALEAARRAVQNRVQP